MIDPGLKQRLVGAAVLIALAVLFLPSILDGRKVQYFEDNLIPAKPKNEKLQKLALELAKNASQDRLTDKNKRDKKAVLGKSVKSKAITNKTANNDRLKQPTAYIIQVASFADAINATNLVDRLKKQQLNAFVGREKVNRNGKKLTRVLIGPVIKQTDAEKILRKVKKNNNLNASIVVYDPRKH